MTYFRMQLLSHGTGPPAPGHVATPLPRGDVALRDTGTARLAVKVQPPRAYLRAARSLPRAGCWSGTGCLHPGRSGGKPHPEPADGTIGAAGRGW